MERKIIFDTDIYGHHLEYLHHIYDAIPNDGNEYIMVIPESFNQEKDKFLWEKKENVNFDFISLSDIDNCKKRGYWGKTINYAKLIRFFVQKHKASYVFLITLILPFPLLPLFLPKHVRVSGILYRIYIYEWKHLSPFVRLKDYLETLIIAKSPHVKTAFILNDNAATCYYNKFFKTQKFQSIIDPVNPIFYKPKEIRSEFGIDTSQKVYLHFGSLSKRKGTLLILDAIKQMKPENLADKVFIFAGKIGNDILKDFYSDTEALKGKANIIILDQFCSFETLCDLCYSSDFILTPYYNYSYSSGVIGYAAFFKKTLIGPSQGVLGKLIKRNHIGYTIKRLTADELSICLRELEPLVNLENHYCQNHDVSSFQKTITKDF